MRYMQKEKGEDGCKEAEVEGKKSGERGKKGGRGGRARRIETVHVLQGMSYLRLAPPLLPPLSLLVEVWEMALMGKIRREKEVGTG